MVMANCTMQVDQYNLNTATMYKVFQYSTATEPIERFEHIQDKSNLLEKKFNLIGLDKLKRQVGFAKFAKIQIYQKIRIFAATLD